MLEFIRYHTPSKHFDKFNEYYSYANLRQVKIISSIIFMLSLFIRISSFFFSKEVATLNFHQEINYANLVQLVGSSIFFLISTYILHRNTASLKQRKAITFFFVVYTLTISFGVSYALTLHNTKNMLMIFLLGIIIISLFFALEFRTIVIVVLYIVTLYFFALYFSSLPTNEKLVNYVAAIILGVALLAFSRYGYYFKSEHFIRIKELEEKNKQILHLNTQKGEILSFVAHDLRAPLNNIEALGGLMLLENENNNEAKIIVNASLQAKRIINDLIEAAKQDRQVLSTETIQLNDFTKNIAAKWSTNTKRDIRFTEGKEVVMNVNPSKLERAIDNLIGNAVKFSPTDQPIDVSVSTVDKNVTIKISDYGIGIPKHLQEHVFEQFSLAGRAGLQGEKSTGLGLHISRKIIEQHQGVLSMNSVENEGTTFTISLPLASA